jgi:ferredoxin
MSNRWLIGPSFQTSSHLLQFGLTAIGLMTICQFILGVCPMPKLNVEGEGVFDVPVGKRLVLALTEDAGIDQLHACGGNARCTTCRVEFLSGEPSTMRDAEKNCLEAKGLSGVRLSCQILCEADMHIRCISRFEGSGRKDSGSPVSPELA